ncbi:uncharacterized protein F4822DRAFT_270263 [Hypoxylon trugodes]|uniref:uncharacterized protein n=1 Tax=Hypoxylon trugodes TaxID=326681 RepID=UPI002198B387|nr:uncharacterized protein F4822DRAFT_270263 [Hypoxylon trugodes]KAI1389120.1 hypothetical protein F4822DRAFT_270263 [Hypoxylon trugodes]
MSLGPLTTTFTPLSDCTASSALYWVNTQSTFYWLHGKPLQSSCFPDSYSPYQNQYYSPGICPVGYTRACEFASTNSEGSIEATRATCCPQGNYVCASTSSSYSYPWGPSLGCMSVYRVDTETSFTTIEGTLAGGESAGDIMSLRAPGTIMAYGVIIQNSGATATTSSSITSSTGSTSSGSAVASETGASASETDSNSDGNKSSGGLSAGAAAGIGIGAALGVLAIVGLIFWLFWSRRRKRKQQLVELESEQYSQQHPGSWGESTTTWGSTPYPQQQQQQYYMPTVNWLPPDPNEPPKEMSAEQQVPIEKDGRNLQYQYPLTDRVIGPGG